MPVWLNLILNKTEDDVVRLQIGFIRAGPHRRRVQRVAEPVAFHFDSHINSLEQPA